MPALRHPLVGDGASAAASLDRGHRYAHEGPSAVAILDLGGSRSLICTLSTRSLTRPSGWRRARGSRQQRTHADHRSVLDRRLEGALSSGLRPDRGFGADPAQTVGWSVPTRGPSTPALPRGRRVSEHGLQALHGGDVALGAMQVERLAPKNVGSGGVSGQQSCLCARLVNERALQQAVLGHKR